MDTRLAIFLAEVTDDLLGQWDEVQRQPDCVIFEYCLLLRSNQRTPCKYPYPDLPQCKLFVQLLSPLFGRHRYPCGNTKAHAAQRFRSCNGTIPHYRSIP